MNYAVIWLPLAIDQLAEAWRTSVNRNAVTAASHNIDMALGTDPYGFGESREGNERIGFEPPLNVLYRVVKEDRHVYVISIHSYARRR